MEASTPPPLPPERPKGWDLVPTNEALIRKYKSGARWLYWVAGLSAVNVLLTHFEVPIRFTIGLGFTEIVYAVGERLGIAVSVFAAVFDVMIFALIFVLGYLAVKGHLWAFVTGIVIMILDTLLLLVLANVSLFINVAIHLLAVVFLFVGYKSLRTYKKRQAEGNA